MAHDLHVHEPPLGHGPRVRRVQHDRRYPAGRDAGGALLARRRKLQDRTPIYDVRGAAGRARFTKAARWSWPMPKPAGSSAGRRPRSRRRQGAQGCAGPSLPEQLDLQRRGRPGAGKNHPFYKVRPVLREPGPMQHDRGSTPRAACRSPQGEKVVLEADYDASRPHTRVMGIMPVFLTLRTTSVTQPCGQRAGRPHRAEEAQGAGQATAPSRCRSSAGAAARP